LLGKVESRRWRAMSSNPYFTDYYSVQWSSCPWIHVHVFPIPGL
jgi:hypothetical protein